MTSCLESCNVVYWLKISVALHTIPGASCTILCGQQYLCMTRWPSYDISELASHISRLAPSLREQ